MTPIKWCYYKEAKLMTPG